MQIAPKPLLIMIGTFGALFTGGTWLIFLPLSLLNIGTYAINGHVVSGIEYFLRAGPAVALIAVPCFATGIGFWRNRSWARTTALLYWTALGAVSVSWALIAGIGWASLALIPFLAVPFMIAFWYFHRKASVVAYYNTLAELEATKQDYSALTPTPWIVRNWRWAVPTGFIALSLTWFGFYTGFTSSDAYRAALDHALSDTEIVSTLGAPIEDGFMPSGNISKKMGGGGSAYLTFSLKGINGSGRVAVALSLEDDGWVVTEMAFEPIEDGSQP